MGRSTVAQKKELSGWRKIGPSCGDCKHFSSEIVEIQNFYGSWMEERKKRCTLWGFATKKRAWCREYSPKTDEKKAKKKGE